MEPIKGLLMISDIWERAWKVQVSRMKTHPEEIPLLIMNAAIAQSNYVMALAEEAVSLKTR